MSAVDTEVILEQIGGGNDLAQNRAGTHELNPRPLGFAAVAQQVHAAQDALLHAVGHFGLRVVLVHHRDVIKDVFLILQHALQALVNDYRDFIAEGWIVSHAIGNYRRHHVTVTVGMLQTLRR